MNEHSFIRSIHKALHPDVYKWKIHDTYTGGVPDAMYAGPAGVLFVEYKYIPKLPKKNTTVIRHSLSSLQCAWLERMKHSTNVALIVGSNSTGVIIQDDFSRNMCKYNYIEENVTKGEIAQWIYNITFSGRANENHRQITASSN